MPMKRTSLVWAALVAVSIIASACSSGTGTSGGAEAVEPKPIALGAGERLRAVATTSLVGDIVARIGGDHIALTTLMASGVDPHSYVPTPADIAAIHDAHALFANGAGLEESLDEIIANAGGNATQILLSDGLELRPLEAGAGESGYAHEEEGQDPHVWFDVRNVMRWVERIEQFLSTLDPANAPIYQANARAYMAELQALDAWIVTEIATIPQDNRKLVINHPVMGYLADRYGLEQIGAVYPLSPAAEPSAQDLAALEETIRRLGVPAVFAENTVSPKLAEQVSKDTGVRLVLLYTDSLGGPGSGAETYVDMMRYDINAIVQALK